jgi:uncharacterized protein (DUF58 family)
MNRTFLAAILLFLLVFVGLAFVRPPIVALALPIVVYLLAGLYRGPEKVQLMATRSLSAERVMSGDQVKVTLTVTNQSRLLEEVLLEDNVPPGLEVVNGSTRRLVRLPVGGSETWTYTLEGQRGYYSMRSVMATVREHFGLVVIQEKLPTDGQLFILPPVLRLRRVVIQPRRTRVYSGTIPARQGGSEVEFFDVRQYQQGDSPRMINWRATARHPQEIFSNEFEQERAADVGIVLDGRRRTNSFRDRSIFEHSILATASLADAFLNAGNRVGLLFYGQQITWTIPGYGRMQSEQILHDLSRLEPGESQTFNEFYVPRHLFPARSQLVLVSSLVPEDFETLATLRIMGYQLMVVSPDPVAFEAAGLPQTHPVLLAQRIAHLQREVMLRRLRGAGIQVVDWDVSLPFEKVAKRQLERRMVLPRGELR